MRNALFIGIALLLSAMQYSAAAAGDDSRERDNRMRWQSMSSQEKKRVIENYHEWKSQPRESREKLRRNFEIYQKLTPEERQKLKQRYRTYRDLEPSQKERLRKRLHKGAARTSGNDQDMTKGSRRRQHVPDEEKMRRIERSRLWREMSREERDIYKKLIKPDN